jgi:fumarate hydratase class II
MNFRNEHDAIGPVDVPAESYAGSFYTRAKNHFQNSSLRAYPSFSTALVWIKQSGAEVNTQLGFLDAKLAAAIEQAGAEFIEGRFMEDYDLDVYQAGAGTPFNMSLNEILANRANEILGGKKGEYNPIHPNNHVNMGQSSNDTIPTALRLAALVDLHRLFRTGTDLLGALEEKADLFKDLVKVGRTHLQDAVPVTLGQEFKAYASSLQHALARLDAAQHELMELGIGGTATGSGINTHTDFSAKMCQALSKRSGLELSPARNRFETTHSLAPFLAVSSACRALATELLRISNDLRLMASGPYAGLNELVLPEVEPGSSIMPGKVNPSVPEALSMICIQVCGLDHAIALCAQQGQLELNWHTPLVMWDLLHQIEILTKGMKMFNHSCIAGLQANTAQLQKVLEDGPVLATVLVPHMGYHAVAELVTRSKKEGIPFSQLVPKEFQDLLNPRKMTEPNL